MIQRYLSLPTLSAAKRYRIELLYLFFLEDEHDSENRRELRKQLIIHRVHAFTFSFSFTRFACLLCCVIIADILIILLSSLISTFISLVRALWLFVFGVFVLLSICCYCGLLIYATYYDCDPLTTGLVSKKDQLLPLLVMDKLGAYPGLPGLFVAGVFSAALSSLSTGLNSMSAVMLEDFFKPFSRKPLSERQTKYVMRGVVAVFGAICVILVFVVERLGAVLQLSMSLGAVAQGPLLGIFTMGVMFPWVTSTVSKVNLCELSFKCLKGEIFCRYIFDFTSSLVYVNAMLVSLSCR